jgi:hypothetical protein
MAIERREGIGRRMGDGMLARQGSTTARNGLFLGWSYVSANYVFYVRRDNAGSTGRVRRKLRCRWMGVTVFME